MKVDHILKLNELYNKYLSIDKFKKIAPTSVVFFNGSDIIPKKGTKSYKKAVKYFHNSLIHSNNLVKIDMASKSETMI